MSFSDRAEKGAHPFRMRSCEWGVFITYSQKVRSSMVALMAAMKLNGLIVSKVFSDSRRDLRALQTSLSSLIQAFQFHLNSSRSSSLWGLGGEAMSKCLHSASRNLFPYV